MQSCARNRVATQQRHPQGKLAGWGHIAPTKNSSISSDSPACKNTTKVNVKVAPDHIQEPVAVFNRFSPLYKIEVLSQRITVDDTLNLI